MYDDGGCMSHDYGGYMSCDDQYAACRNGRYAQPTKAIQMIAEDTRPSANAKAVHLMKAAHVTTEDRRCIPLAVV